MTPSSAEAPAMVSHAWERVRFHRYRTEARVVIPKAR
jgi:hypothetical protein